jgi:hypothetical protein
VVFVLSCKVMIDQDLDFFKEVEYSPWHSCRCNVKNMLEVAKFTTARIAEGARAAGLVAEVACSRYSRTGSETHLALVRQALWT